MVNVEQQRLDEADGRGVPWRRWGPCLSERQWGVGTARTTVAALTRGRRSPMITPRPRQRMCCAPAFVAYPERRDLSGQRWRNDGLAGTTGDL